MSFHIGFTMKDLVMLAADRQARIFYKSGEIGKDIFDCQKLFRIKKRVYFIGDGWHEFSRRWLFFFKLFLILSEKALKALEPIIRNDYIYQWLKLKKKGAILSFPSNIVLGGFLSEKAFIYAWNTEDNFSPSVSRLGYIHGQVRCTKDNDYKARIKKIGDLLFAMQNDSIETRQVFLRHHMIELFKYLNNNSEFVSTNFDIVFITKNGSACESLG